ncbi:hypothetical protein RJZ90_004275 [Blastomyces dermatitidis]
MQSLNSTQCMLPPVAASNEHPEPVGWSLVQNSERLKQLSLNDTGGQIKRRQLFLKVDVSMLTSKVTKTKLLLLAPAGFGGCGRREGSPLPQGVRYTDRGYGLFTFPDYV